MHRHQTIVNNALSQDPIAANLFTNRRGGARVSHVPSVIRYPFYYDTWSALRPIIRDDRVFSLPHEHDLTNVVKDIDRITLKMSKVVDEITGEYGKEQYIIDELNQI